MLFLQLCHVTCFNGTNGTLAVSVTGGTPTYTYLWNTGATTTMITGLTAGLYTVTVTDAAGCILQHNLTVLQPDQLQTTATLTHVNCNNAATGAINISVSGGVSPYSFMWSSGATTEDVSSLSSGTYSITVVDNSGCTSLFSFIINQSDPYVISATVSCNLL